MKVKYTLELEMEIEEAIYKTDGLPFSKKTVEQIELSEFKNGWIRYLNGNFPFMNLVKAQISVVD